MGFVDGGERPVELLLVRGIEGELVEMLVVGRQRAGAG